MKVFFNHLVFDYFVVAGVRDDRSEDTPKSLAEIQFRDDEARYWEEQRRAPVSGNTKQKDVEANSYHCSVAVIS